MTQEQLNKLLDKAREQDALGTEEGNADRDRLIQMYSDGSVPANPPSGIKGNWRVH